MTMKRTTTPAKPRAPKTTTPRATTRRKAASPVEVTVPPAATPTDTAAAPAELVAPPAEPVATAVDATPIVAPLRAAAGQADPARTPLPASLLEHIRTRAYFLSLERQGRPGNPEEDWLIAEREIVAGLRR